MKKNQIWNIMAAALLAFVLGGCAVFDSGGKSAGDGLQRGDAVVYIYPERGDVYRHYSVGVAPFLLPENIDPRLSGSVAGMFKDVLLGKRVFPVVKMLPAEEPLPPAAALSSGRKAGVDLVLAGTVNYLIEGTELGGARLDLAVRLLNVHTGQTVWYIGQAMDQPLDTPKSDLYHFLVDSMFPPEIRRSEGGPAVANMLARSAVQVAEIMGGETTVRR